MKLSRFTRRPVYGYLFAVGSVVFFTALKIYLDRYFGTDRPFFFMRLPVVMAALFFGIGPAVLALALGSLAVQFFFTRPYFTFQSLSSSWYPQVLFISESLLLIALATLMRRAQQRAARETEKLRQTEQRFEMALGATGIIVYHTDRDLRYTWMYNVHPEFRGVDLIGKRDDELLPPEQARPILETKQQVLDTGVGVRTDFTITLGDSRHVLEHIIEPLRGDGGEILGLTIAVTDVTDRKALEERVHEEENNFRQLADSMPQIVWTARPDGYVDYWNRRWYEFTSFREGEGGDDSWTPALHPDDVQPALNAWYHAVRTGELFQMECRMRDLKTGDYRWFLSRAVPVRSESGEILKWYGTLTDIDETKRGQEALRRSDERYRSLVAATAQIVWQTNEHGEVEDVPQWRAYTGQSVEQAAGFGWLDAVHPDDQKSTAQAWANALKDGSMYDVEYRLLGKDGHYRWFGTRGVPVRDTGGNIREWVGLCVDIEPQKRVEEQMRRAAAAMEVARDAAVQANRAKSTFLANMSHELRTPLTAILGYAEIMQEDLKQSSRPQMLADVGHILGAGNHLLTVVNDLLDISKIEAGRMGVDARPFHVPDLLRDVQHTVMPLAERNRNELQFEIKEDVGIATGDPIKLRQILANLLSNACKFTENGKVLLRCWRDQNGSGDQFYFAVSDTGIGISPDDLPRLFHEFSQLDSSFTRRYSGTGLGLVLCKRFAELMGGSISVESEPGKGSTFTLRIPAEAPSGSKPGSTKMVAQ